MGREELKGEEVEGSERKGSSGREELKVKEVVRGGSG